MRWLAIILLVCTQAFAAPWTPSSESSPPSWEPHRTDGTGTGIPGGIIVRPTSGRTTFNVVTGNSVDNTGATDVTSAIQSVLNGATSGDVVYMPAGTYKTTAPLTVPSGITLRGDGLGEPGETGWTKIDFRPSSENGVAISLDGAGQETWTGTTTAITAASMTKGAETITVASTTDFVVGRTARIKVGNGSSTTFPVVKFDALDGQVHFFPVEITEIVDSTHLKVSPKIYRDFTGATNMTITAAQYAAGSVGAGIENIHIDGENVNRAGGKKLFHGIYIGSLARNVWLKNVKVTNYDNHGVYIMDGVRHEIIDCRLENAYGSGTNHAGLLVDSANGLLVWNSIFRRGSPGVELNMGVVGSAVAYNFFDSNYTGLNFDINHGPLNSHNLYEGNYSPGIHSDGYFGGSFYDTLYRNWVSGLPNINDGTAAQSFAIALNRASRGANVVGNILLAPGYTWTSYTDNGIAYGYGASNMSGTAKLSTGDAWEAWDTTTHLPKAYTGTLTTRTDDLSGQITFDTGEATRFSALVTSMGGYGVPVSLKTSGVDFITPRSMAGSVMTFDTASNPLPALSSAVTILPGTYGFNELDQDVEATATQKHNFNHRTGDIPSGEALSGGTTLGDSLMGFTTSSPPSFFTDASISFPPYNPEDAYVAEKGSIPAGFRALFTETPTIESAYMTATEIVVQINKPVTPTGGTSGFSVDASGLSLTYDYVSGSTIHFTPSRTINSGESIYLTFTATTDEWEDSNGNDLASRSAFRMTNLSSATGAKVLYWSTNPDAATNYRALPGQGISKAVPVDITVSGVADAVVIPIYLNPYSGNMKIGVYDASFTRVASISETVSLEGERQFFPTSFTVSPQRYWVVFQSFSNDAPTIASLDEGLGATKEEYTSYASFPPTSVSLSGSLGYTFAIGLEIIPNTSATVTNTTVTGSLNLP